uniref:Uncharacterized LOC103177496 n=1 Tax=Callorhinchus milii TaxID=7868 RepID=A0A4W3IRA2_CALMI
MAAVSDSHFRVKVEDDTEAVIFDGAEMVDIQNGSPSLAPEDQSQVNYPKRYLAAVAYVKKPEEEDASNVSNINTVESSGNLQQECLSIRSNVLPASTTQEDRWSGGQYCYSYRPKRRKISTLIHNVPEENTRDSGDYTQYEENGDHVYDYNPDYECASEASEGSYVADQQRTLVEVLNYCQVMYAAIQRLDKKFDVLYRRVTEMQQGRGKPMFFEPRVMTVSYGNTHQMPLNQMRNQKPVEREVRIRMPPPDLGSRSSPVRIRVQKEPMKVTIPAKGVHSTSQAQSLYTCRARRSPPLPTIHSVQSLKEPTMQYSPATGMPDFTQGNTILVQDSRVHVSSGTNDIVSSTARHYPDGSFLQETLDNINTLNDPRRQNSFSKAEELPSSSSAASMSFEYLGDLSRNVRVPAAFLMKARQKTKPKYVARYLIRTMFPKETLMYSNMQGDRARAIKPLDSNKIAALREFLCMLFPTYDLSEQGKDWKICVSNVNSMIRSLRCEIRRGASRGLAYC